MVYRRRRRPLFSRRFKLAYNKIMVPHLRKMGKKGKIGFRMRKRRQRRNRRMRRKTIGYPRGIGSLGPTSMNFFAPVKRIKSYFEIGFTLSAPSTETSISGKTIRLRDWYDPDYALGGENAVDRLFWSNFYKYYRVRAIKFQLKMEASSSTTIDSKCGFYVTRINESGPQDLHTGVEFVPIPSNQPHWTQWLTDRKRIIKEKTIGGNARQGHYDPNFTCYVDLDKYDQIGGRNRILEDASQQPITTEGQDFLIGRTRAISTSDPYGHPKKSNYLHIYTREGPSGGTGTGVVCTLRLWFYIDLSAPQTVFHHTADSAVEYDDNFITRAEVDYPTGETPPP